MKTLEEYKALCETLAEDLEETHRKIESMRAQNPLIQAVFTADRRIIQWEWFDPEQGSAEIQLVAMKYGKRVTNLYAQPVYEKSFTLIGAGTVYGDQEMITQIERKFGIKPHLTLVE